MKACAIILNSIALFLVSVSIANAQKDSTSLRSPIEFGGASISAGSAWGGAETAP
jgi:hypothetical protein